LNVWIAIAAKKNQKIVKSKFKKNKIKELKLKIDCNDGYKGEIIIKNSTLKTIPKGFIRRYNDKEIPFKTW